MLAALILTGVLPARAQTAQASPDAGQSPADVIESIIVQADRASASPPAAKIAAPLHDLPITVDQIPQSQIEDRGVVSTDQALDTVAGVRQTPSFPGVDSYVICGFNELHHALVDGLRDNSGLTDPQDIVRIDVLKGPPSVLFGSQSVGGVANIVTKSPGPLAFYQAEFTAGSFGERRATVDVNQPIDNGIGVGTAERYLRGC